MTLDNVREVAASLPVSPVPEFLSVTVHPPFQSFWSIEQGYSGSRLTTKIVLQTRDHLCIAYQLLDVSYVAFRVLFSSSIFPIKRPKLS